MKIASVALCVGVAGVLVAVALTGCRRTVVVVGQDSPPPQVVYVQPPPTETIVVDQAPPAVVFVQQAPPEPIYEVIQPAPVGFIWVGGYWFWEHDHYGWVRGHNVRGQEGARWVAPRWEHGSRGWEQHQGHFQRGADRGPAGRGAPSGGRR